MKKYILLVFLIAVIGSLVFVPACKRSAQANPDMHEPAGFIINLSGVANPGTLFVAQGISSVTSNIALTALYNDGTPVSGKNIVMKIGDDIGYFVQNNKRYAVIMTNSQGKAHIDYKVAAYQHTDIGSNLLIYIQAWMQVDLYNVFELIPIQLVTNMPDTVGNTFAYMIIANPDTDTGDDDIDMPAGGSVSVYFYNSTGTDTIDYEFTVNDPNLIITSHSTGDTGSTDTVETFTTHATNTGTATITVTALSPSDVFGVTITIEITTS